MAIESLEAIAAELGTPPLDSAATRRNVITRGLDIDGLRGRAFTLGGVRFHAHRAANPCAWMDVALAPGAFRALRGRGGMRCSPLTDGLLTLGTTEFALAPE